jgi:hypothetical protein
VYEDWNAGSEGLLHEAADTERTRVEWRAGAPPAPAAAPEPAPPRDRPRGPRREPAAGGPLAFEIAPRPALAALSDTRPPGPPAGAAIPPPIAPATRPVPEPPAMRRIDSQVRAEPPVAPRRAASPSAARPDAASSASVSPRPAAGARPLAGIHPRPISAPLPLDRVDPPREPDVVVTIGRIELRTVAEQPAPARPARTGASRPSLDEYLRRGAKGRT